MLKEGMPVAWRLDAYPYSHRVSELVSSAPVYVEPETALAEAAALMVDRQVSALLVDREGRAGGPGIVTERDTVRALARRGAEALAMPCGALMSTPLAGVDADDLIHVAIGRLTRLGPAPSRGVRRRRRALRHRHAGTSQPPPFRRRPGDQRRDQGGVGREGSRRGPCAPPADGLGAGRGGCRGVDRRRARRRGLPRPHETRRADRGGRDRCPRPPRYALVVLGSAGRGESLLAGDQDNAIIHEEGADDACLERIASRMCDILDSAGLPYCKGGVMASRPDWRRSLAGWAATVEAWTRRASGSSLLNADIFFDLVHVHGDRSLVDELRSQALAAARKPLLPRMMAEELQSHRSPLDLFGRFRLADGRFDLKLGGLFPLVAGSRAMALRHAVEATGTRDRMTALSGMGLIADGDLA